MFCGFLTGTTTNIASANIADSATIWIEDDDGKVAFGEQGDVSLFKNPSGAHGLRTGANLTIDGDVIIQDTALLASLKQVQEDVATLDSVAIKSSNAGTQTLGAVTATSLAVTDGIKLGAAEALTDSERYFVYDDDSDRTNHIAAVSNYAALRAICTDRGARMAWHAATCAWCASRETRAVWVV